jgi:uncharacterized membrane protein YoaK (UPF0700 family)
LIALAGYVDAIAAVQLGGYFASFMSGNSTRSAVGLLEQSVEFTVVGGLILSFVCGERWTRWPDAWQAIEVDPSY